MGSDPYIFDFKRAKFSNCSAKGRSNYSDFGHNQPNVPAVSAAKITLSKRCLNVTTQLRPFQIDSWAWAAPYPSKAVILTMRNTCKKAVPGASVRPDR